MLSYSLCLIFHIGHVSSYTLVISLFSLDPFVDETVPFLCRLRERNSVQNSFARCGELFSRSFDIELRPLDSRLKVTCDGTHLHYVQAHQFVDSPEWEATHENDADVFQVTIRAEESSTYICWTKMKLLRVLRHRPLLKVVINTLIGKDITSKLYALNEQLAGVATASENATSNPYRAVSRSLSVDAVNTETAGKVRSTTWKEQKRYTNSCSNSKCRTVFSMLNDRLLSRFTQHRSS